MDKKLMTIIGGLFLASALLAGGLFYLNVNQESVTAPDENNAITDEKSLQELTEYDLSSFKVSSIYATEITGSDAVEFSYGDSTLSISVSENQELTKEQIANDFIENRVTEEVQPTVKLDKYDVNEVDFAAVYFTEQSIKKIYMVGQIENSIIEVLASGSDFGPVEIGVQISQIEFKL